MIRAATAQRSRRNPPTRVKGSVGSDRTVLRYNAIGSSVSTDALGNLAWDRWYVPGNSAGISSSAGVNVARHYSTGVFRPGTTCKWVPYVGYQTTGRVLVTFTDNPEVMANVGGWSLAQRLSYIRSSSYATNFPIYEEKVIAVPAITRRKRFDTNTTIDLSSVDSLDRSAQVMMITAVIAAPASTLVGQWEHHDVLDVEGLNNANVDT